MKKVILFTLLLTVGLLAKAADYPYLTFTSSDGTKVSLSVSSLELTVSGSNLVATNGSSSKTFALSELSNMFFSATDESSVTGISTVDATTTDGAVKVFTLNGVLMGTYDSVEAAKSALPAGIYVIGKKKMVIE